MALPWGMLPTLPVEVVSRLVNGWGTVPRAEAGESQLPYPSVKDVLADADLPERLLATLTEDSLCATADLLFPVFAATGSAARVDAGNALLVRAGVRPALQLRNDRIERAWLAGDSSDGGEWLLAAAAIALHEQLADHDPDRLGTCAGDRCADVYVDASPAGRRRFCSVTCQTRARVAAFRRRSGSAPGGPC
jgi:predicted RNA-binding Zn ribbon-like protein